MPSNAHPKFGELPSSLRALCVSSTGETNWLQPLLAADNAIQLDLVHATVDAAMKLLREAMFDLVILCETDDFDATRVIAPLRTAAPDQLAIVVLSQSEDADRCAVCLDVGADDFLLLRRTTIRTLLWKLSRAAERQLLLLDHHTRMQHKETQQREDHQEALHQLRTQRALLLEHSADDQDPNPPEWLIDYFSDLVRMYVVSGVGNHQDEVGQLVDRLDHCRVTLAEALTAHSVAVEQLVLGRRGRSAWHILGRANLISLELVMQWEARRKTDATIPGPSGR